MTNITITADAYDEELAIAAPVSPCSTQEVPKSSLPTPSVTSKFVNIESYYIIDKAVLGTGQQGIVRRCINRQTGRQYAVKSICKSHPSVIIEFVLHEINLLVKMKHKNIAQLLDVYEDEHYVHLVTELCHGGELYERIYFKRFNLENKAAFQNKRLQEYCSRYTILSTEMTTAVGTPYYNSPQVLQKSYDKSCDLWSIGVIAYILLVGYPPFNGGTSEEVNANVCKGAYRFDEKDWRPISMGAQNFIASLLQMDTSKRMTAEQALRHPWILSHVPMTSVIESRDVIEVVHERESERDLLSDIV
eukprot:scaffold17175_cov65-Cyclotella_meneghiniana.AAC.2